MIATPSNSRSPYSHALRSTVSFWVYRWSRQIKSLGLVGSVGRGPNALCIQSNSTCSGTADPTTIWNITTADSARSSEPTASGKPQRSHRLLLLSSWLLGGIPGPSLGVRDSTEDSSPISLVVERDWIYCLTPWMSLQCCSSGRVIRASMSVLVGSP